MRFSSGKKSLELKDILNNISEADILGYYLGINKIPCLINSPLRKDDKASFYLYSKDGQTVYYIDFVKKDVHGDTFQLLQELWGLSLIQVIDKIYNELINVSNHVQVEKSIGYAKTNIIEDDTIKNYIFKTNNIKTNIIKNNTSNLQCKIRDWKDYDLEYWSSYGISKDWLYFGDVYPISHIIITKEDGTVFTIHADKYAYAYVERKDNIVSLKIYQPFNTKYKWANKHDHSVWDLWTKLPESGEKLIITSSRKDALNLWSNLGIPSVSLQGEGYIPKKHVVEELKQRFKKIYVFFDNDFSNPDNPGLAYGKTIASKFGLTQIIIPKEYEAKDPSDLYKKHGKTTYLKCLYELFKN